MSLSDTNSTIDRLQEQITELEGRVIELQLSLNICTHDYRLQEKIDSTRYRC